MLNFGYVNTRHTTTLPPTGEGFVPMAIVKFIVNRRCQMLDHTTLPPTGDGLALWQITNVLCVNDAINRHMCTVFTDHASQVLKAFTADDQRGRPPSARQHAVQHQEILSLFSMGKLAGVMGIYGPPSKTILCCRCPKGPNAKT